jgi:peptidoglycan/xylan/chitin deacetylase (PgdA/CDA1 family)
MPLRRLARHAKESWEVPRDLLLGRYPPFVTGGPLPKGHVPVFVFHSLEPKSFGRKLRYLADNRYVTLSADEYFQALMGARPVPERAVLLTFDDGRGSLYSVGLPLMRRFGMRGMVFLIPGHMRSRPGPLPPTWDDVSGGGVTESAVLAHESGPDGTFLSWEEMDVLQRSGLFDFQSHTLTHSRVHVVPKLAGFVGPDDRAGYAALEVPLIREGERDLPAGQVPLGTPLLRSRPRTAEALRFFEDPSLRDACVRAVEQEGGADFFARKGWARRLHRLADRREVAGRYETPQEREAAIGHEMSESRRLIEERTGRTVVHLCYPWHAWGPTARRLARDAGYRTAFCGKVRGVPITLAGGDPLAIARIGEDYLELLPGRGRADLTTILRRKLDRRARRGT